MRRLIDAVRKVARPFAHALRRLAHTRTPEDIVIDQFLRRAAQLFGDL